MMNYPFTKEFPYERKNYPGAGHHRRRPGGAGGAVAAAENGIAPRDILILEREPELGGILLQCIHNGFGIHRFGEELSGPEYAARFAKKAAELKIPALTSTMVLSLEADGRG